MVSRFTAIVFALFIDFLLKTGFAPSYEKIAALK